MVYREPADRIASRESEPTGPLEHIVADGRTGANAEDGSHGHSGRGSGRDGSNGGNAGEASPGENGGTIQIELAADPGRDGIATLRGTLDARANGGRKELEAEIAFARRGAIELWARGGVGGDGGRGGDGGDGARGSSGSDASRYSSGGDGGPGGDGGDSGDGSNGGRGGAGGSIVVRTSDRDTHLLMLVTTDMRPGAGGKAGMNGAVGAGGPGGSGGSSYSWTESESYTDSQGNSQTRSTSHSNSGGSRGRSGRDGRASTARPEEGPDGEPGSFAIEVVGEGGSTKRYASRYDLRVIGFRHRNANDDGIYEPEEAVFVSEIAVANIGGMPTPAHHEIRIGVVDDGWIAPRDKTLVLPRSLAAGARHVFTNEELELALRVFRPQAPGAPLAAAETIRLFADLPDAKRRFAGFEVSAPANDGKIVVRFPIEESPVASLFSLAPGQAARVRWSITNVSEKAFGADSDLHRTLSVHLGIAGGDLGPDAVHVFWTDGTRVSPEAGLRIAVPRLEPKQSVGFEATIAIASSAPPYASARLVATAELGHIADPDRVRPIQTQELVVRVGRPFEARDADVLVVVNNRTVAAELEAWEAHVRALGLSPVVWDASLECGLGILDDVAEGRRTFSLVVILNNTMDTASGERRASVLVDKATMLALARAGVHVLHVGRGPELDRLLVPTAPGEPIVVAGDAKKDELVRACEGLAIGDHSATVTALASYAWPWSEPESTHLDKRAKALAEVLEARWPDRRYVVVPRYAPALERKAAWIRIMRLGTLEIRRSLDASRSAITSVDADAKEMHRPEYVADARSLTLVASSLPFEAKVKLLGSPRPYDARVGDGCEDAIAAAVLSDLVREQEAARDVGELLSAKRLRAAMPMLAIFESTAAPSRERAIELCAWLDLVARGHARWFEWIPPFPWLATGTNLRRILRSAIAKVIARVAGSEAETKAMNDAVAVRQKAIAIALRDARKFDRTLRGAGFARARLDAYYTDRAITTDGSILRTGERVIASDRYDELRAKDDDRRSRSRAALGSATEARAALLVTETCEELLGRAKMRVVVTAEPEPIEEATPDDLAALRQR